MDHADGVRTAAELGTALRVVGDRVVCGRPDCGGCDPDRPRGFACERQPRTSLADLLRGRGSEAASRAAIAHAADLDVLASRMNALAVAVDDGDVEAIQRRFGRVQEIVTVLVEPATPGADR